ncbi:hypothetical protein BDM02DRAFT_1757273 [Thelephora ganbajun]|uniref:Uncharacterized protein n=1 Tax=Thelephora ganbajun TaxID=370292 RepID=A0ACB6ZK96_THEGA|nr:hypothetical protein BDM02DRAFT_1757273 [Thelephora ganbajun]
MIDSLECGTFSNRCTQNPEYRIFSQTKDLDDEVADPLGKLRGFFLCVSPVPVSVRPQPFGRHRSQSLPTTPTMHMHEPSFAIGAWFMQLFLPLRLRPRCCSFPVVGTSPVVFFHELIRSYHRCL